MFFFSSCTQISDLAVCAVEELPEFTHRVEQADLSKTVDTERISSLDTRFVVESWLGGAEVGVVRVDEVESRKTIIMNVLGRNDWDTVVGCNNETSVHTWDTLNAVDAWGHTLHLGETLLWLEELLDLLNGVVARENDLGLTSRPKDFTKC